MQQWVCRQISALLDLPWGKDTLIASREMGQSGTDVRLLGDAAVRFPFSIECKNQETWSLPTWIEQARRNQAPGTRWLLIVKKNRLAPIAVMDAEEFFSLWQGLQHGTDPQCDDRELPES